MAGMRKRVTWHASYAFFILSLYYEAHHPPIDAPARCAGARGRVVQRILISDWNIKDRVGKDGVFDRPIRHRHPARCSTLSFLVASHFDSCNSFIRRRDALCTYVQQSGAATRLRFHSLFSFPLLFRRGTRPLHPIFIHRERVRMHRERREREKRLCSCLSKKKRLSLRRRLLRHGTFSITSTIWYRRGR